MNIQISFWISIIININHYQIHIIIDNQSIYSLFFVINLTPFYQLLPQSLFFVKNFLSNHGWNGILDTIIVDKDKSG